MFVLGTAGHVDHGKSALVRALTGIDPDRLPVEQRRGLTTDLGFAWLTLPSGRDVSLVDVPGHARYVKNMLSGSSAIDLALLVVAADEGPMPQTREHLAILELQQVPGMVCVLTKIDRVEPEYADLAQAEFEATLVHTPFAGSPCVRTSVRTGEGLEELTSMIDRALDSLPPRNDLGAPRMAIDRVFTVKGFGTVVTGTLVGGRLRAGDEIELQPGSIPGRIRGLQRHGVGVADVEPGTRVAVNVIGAASEAALRGMTLARPGTVRAANIVDVSVRVPAIVEGSLRHNEGITLLCGTAEAEGRLRLLDGETIAPGGQGWAQAVLDTPLAFVAGDRCIIRTPNETVAGGTVVALNPRRHRRNDAAVLAALTLQARGSLRDRLLLLLGDGPRSQASLAGSLSVPQADVDAVVRALTAERAVEDIHGQLYSLPWLAAAADRVAAATDVFLHENPLRSSAPREHVRRAAQLDARAFEAAVADAIRGGRLAGPGAEGLAPPGYEVVLPEALQAESDAFVASLIQGRFSPPTDHLPTPPVLAYLVERGSVVSTGAGVVFARGAFDEMLERITAFLAGHGSISLAETRDLFGTTRKYAQAFLEQLDALHITRRAGETRVLMRRETGRLRSP
ncbi:MAG: selenocysteine-specific translation elongation factor [Tepidiformaceae bacterium]